MRLLFILGLSLTVPLWSDLPTDSVLSSLNEVYTLDLHDKVSQQQQEEMEWAIAKKNEALRVMTYNMLYNAQSAEAKLPPQHHWDLRKERVIAYLHYADVDLIGSQELQVDQLEDLMRALGTKYDCFGDVTREEEGRSDVNAIFYKKERLELLDGRTILYKGGKGFTVAQFKDMKTDKIFVAINTKFTWNNPEARKEEATQLHDYLGQVDQKQGVVVLGDFNTIPCIEHLINLFLDGPYVENILKGDVLKDAKDLSIFGHIGPLCSVTFSKWLVPFSGPELTGFILDHIYVNALVSVFSHGIDTVKVGGEYPSDHFPVVADLYFN